MIVSEHILYVCHVCYMGKLKATIRNPEKDTSGPARGFPLLEAILEARLPLCYRIYFCFITKNIFLSALRTPSPALAFRCRSSSQSALAVELLQMGKAGGQFSGDAAFPIRSLPVTRSHHQRQHEGRRS